MSLNHRPSRVSVLCAFAFFAALALAQNHLAASAFDPEITQSGSVPEPRSTDQEVKLAGDYFMGHGVAQDLQLAAYWYQKAAQDGDPGAQMQIGYFYETGTGVRKDPVRAVHWYQLAVSAGLVAAKVNLGTAYMWGTGVKRDQVLAAKFFRDAAHQGSGVAAFYLGQMYYFGDGVAQDRVAAEKWYAKAAKLRNPRGQYALGQLLFVEKDHPHDPEKAASWFRKSAAAGYVLAQYSLGLLLVRNPGLAKSPTEALPLLNQAADAGVWQASVVLGLLARDGLLVPVDSNAAYFHFRVAALQGGDVARTTVEADLRNLSAKLGASDVRAINSQAETWLEGHQLELQFVFSPEDNSTRFPAYAIAAPESGAHAGQLLPALPK